jgi:ubiquitin C-terminal hydrolase
MSTRFGQSVQKPIYPRHVPNPSNIMINRGDESKLPMGLQNIGNTCFLNSIIQFLYAPSKFRDFLIEKYGKSQLFK